MVASALLDSLAREIGEGDAVYEVRPTPLDGGRSADLFRFRLSSGPSVLCGRDLVLRVLPIGATSADEIVIQRSVAGLGYPAPDVLVSGVANGSRRYVIMPFVEGGSLFDAGYRLGAFRRVPSQLADLMLALHALDATSVRRSLAASGPSAALDAQARALEDVDRSFAVSGHPAHADLRAWFDATRPSVDREVVCHGDLHALNVLVNGEMAVVDWELAAIGDPAFDVARTKLLLRAVPMEIPRAARPMIQRLGRRAAARFEQAYLARSALPVEAIRWYEALHAARMIGGVLGARAAQEPPDAVIAGWAPTLPLLVAELKRGTGVEVTI